jgi:hypothetical protein
LEWKKSVLACLEWLGVEKVGFGLTGMAWNKGSWVLPRNFFRTNLFHLIKLGEA